MKNVQVELEGMFLNSMPGDWICVAHDTWRGAKLEKFCENACLHSKRTGTSQRRNLCESSKISLFLYDREIKEFILSKFLNERKSSRQQHWEWKKESITFFYSKQESQSKKQKRTKTTQKSKQDYFFWISFSNFIKFQYFTIFFFYIFRRQNVQKLNNSQTEFHFFFETKT